MSLHPSEIDHAFMARLMAHQDAGFPPGEAPDLANFPDRELAMGGWTRGFPRIDPLTGLELADGEESLVQLQRRVARELLEQEQALVKTGRWTHYHRAHKLRRRAFKDGVRTRLWPRYNHYVQLANRKRHSARR